MKKQADKRGDKLTQQFELVEIHDEYCLQQIVTQSTRKEEILDVVLTNSTACRGTFVLDNGEYSDHSTVYVNIVLPLSDEDKEDELHFHKTEIPLYDIDVMEDEDWDRFRKNLRNQEWTNVSLMSSKELQDLLTKNIEEAVKLSAKRKKSGRKGKISRHR